MNNKFREMMDRSAKRAMLRTKEYREFTVKNFVSWKSEEDLKRFAYENRYQKIKDKREEQKQKPSHDKMRELPSIEE